MHYHLESFSIRPYSGGSGHYPGGNGVIRRIQFRSAMTANILSGRRSTVPFGLAGGGNGLPGCTTLERRDGTRSVLSYSGSVEVEVGDCMTIETPGGGGYGEPSIESLKLMSGCPAMTDCPG